MEPLKVIGFELDRGHLTAAVELPSGDQASFRYCPGRSAVLDDAMETFAKALRDVVILTLIESVPHAPDAPVEAIRPCRICDAVTPDNEADERGHVFCPDHRPPGAA